jgi:hypothetical protein
MRMLAKLFRILAKTTTAPLTGHRGEMFWMGLNWVEPEPVAFGIQEAP